MIERLAEMATAPWAMGSDVNIFAATTLELAEVPGICELSIPYLKKLTFFKDASSARFASNILVRMEERITDGTVVPMSRLE